MSAAPLARALVDWYRAHARDLPWRRDAADPVHGPYRVWVSEIMLQQTQVATVVPYYLRWMEAWPTLAALAAAPEEDVLARWAGLGYYARCRNLLRAARQVAQVHEGRLPRDAEALAALPGIGPYTVGAIRSIAFGEKEPLVDGNVARVLCRLHGIEGDPASAPVSARLWAEARALVEASDDPSALNQGLMELGATLCTPAAPACLLCPWAAACEARRTHRQEVLPVPRKRPRRRSEQALCAVARRPNGEVLLARRDGRGLLGGLFEPPRVAAEAVAGARALGTVTHVFTHLELTLHVFEVAVPPRRRGPAPEGPYVETRWVAPAELAAAPLSTLARKVLRLAGLDAARR